MPGQGQRPQQMQARNEVGTSGTVPNESARSSGNKSRAAVWVFQDGKLHPVRVDAGITDGTMTAIAGGGLVERAQVVTGLASRPGSTSAAPAGSPLLPARGRGRAAGAGRQ